MIDIKFIDRKYVEKDVFCHFTSVEQRKKKKRKRDLICCGSVVEHWTPESEGIRFNSTWRLRIFSLSHACDKTKNIFLYFFSELKPYDLSYSI